MDIIKEYHLLKKGKRVIISDKVQKGFEIIKTVIAINWLDAKAKLGFALTNKQSLTLKRSLEDDS